MRKVGLVLFLVAAVCGVASADWAPPTVDYTVAAQSVVTAIGTLLTSVIPIALALLGIMMGPRIVLGLIRRFSK